MRKIEKITISISVDKKLDGYMEELMSNKSKYIEDLVYQDMLKKDRKVEKIIV